MKPRKRQLLQSLQSSFDASDIIGGICTELLTPSLEKYRHGGSMRYDSSMKEARQFLRDCKEKQTVEAEKLHEQEKRKNFLKVKKSLMTYCRRPNNLAEKGKQHKKSVQKRLDTSQYLNKVDLQRKYGTLWSIKLQALEQSERIGEYKRWIEKWNNRSNLHLSPNVRKMNFLLEKVEQRRDLLPGMELIGLGRRQRNTFDGPRSPSNHYTSLSATKSKLW